MLRVNRNDYEIGYTIYLLFMFLEDIEGKYSTMDATKKKELLSQHNEKLVKARLVELCINQLKRKIREGPYFICTVCNQIL
ncbi:hypothetical protein pdam_00016505 [Pocillopora damicornis]|uniref:Uncharacterized protein n=1 Tax=Pocillopora damicornis TaxID=46731 RepID=A0A3M6TUR4_POCDA|nr:hypothetical protein pdam_00016505 [Pocillopora damicornis]